MARAWLAPALLLGALGALAASPVGGRAEAGGPTPKHWGQPRFAGKAIFVTGGDSGIGLAAVEAFFFECGSVMMVGHSVTKTQQAWANLTAMPPPSNCPTRPKLAWAAIDISNATAVWEAINRTKDELGGLDVAVNNAGVFGSSLQIGDAGFIESFESSPELRVNIEGTLRCMTAQLQAWTAAKTPGVMVNVASICGETSWCPPAYATSKWATIGFSKQAASQYAEHGIRVNVVAPGLVETPMLRGGLAPDDPAWLKAKAQLEAIVPMRHIAQPWEMAGPITFLASDMSSYVTGHVLTADGNIKDGAGNFFKRPSGSVPPASKLTAAAAQQEASIILV
mmetsp:Transcript_38433/g.116218  ORF Transcript_38433/g.116218 Transcript_38433/m.116218 type:complete len:338 (-) Transcript_38433:367-1380(-)